jgi:polar amino acid transport system substrate-binding protein
VATTVVTRRSTAAAALGLAGALALAGCANPTDGGTTEVAARSGRIDLYLGPDPTAAHHAATTGKTEVVGTYSGAGAGLQGLIAATTKKDNGLAKPLADAVDHVIENGTDAKVLKRRGLSGEAVRKSEINPPGLPKTGS